MATGTYLAFLLTAVAMCLSPGPDTLLVLSRTLASGTRAGLATVLGTQAGNLVHALLAGVGVSTLVLLVPFAFDALRYGGGAYLAWLAVASWRAGAGAGPDAAAAAPGAGGARAPVRCFADGLFNNLVNPKMIPFFLALFPQFVDPQGPALAQSLLLGGTLSAIGLAWLSFLVVLAGRFRRDVAGNPAFLAWSNRLAALVFALLALRLVAGG